MNTYPRFTFSPTVHKILYHGHDYIDNFPSIPLGNIKIVISKNFPKFTVNIILGSLSEEPQEARNKHFKKYRSDFSRKTSRKDNLEDIFNRFLISSDPIFFQIYKKFQGPQNKLNLPPLKIGEDLPADETHMATEYYCQSDSEEELEESGGESCHEENEFEDSI